MTMQMQSHPAGRPTTPLALALAWGFVGIPLAWGVVETVLNAMALFR
jgi:hypothetical protein